MSTSTLNLTKSAQLNDLLSSFSLFLIKNHSLPEKNEIFLSWQLVWSSISGTTEFVLHS